MRFWALPLALVAACGGGTDCPEGSVVIAGAEDVCLQLSADCPGGTFLDPATDTCVGPTGEVVDTTTDDPGDDTPDDPGDDTTDDPGDDDPGDTEPDDDDPVDPGEDPSWGTPIAIPDPLGLDAFTTLLDEESCARTDVCRANEGLPADTCPPVAYDPACALRVDEATCCLELLQVAVCDGPSLVLPLVCDPAVWCEPPEPPDYLEPDVVSVSVAFTYDTARDRAEFYTSSLGTFQPDVALRIGNDQWDGDPTDLVNSCTVNVEAPGPRPRAGFTASVADAVFGIDLGATAIVSDTCTGRLDPSRFPGLAANVASADWQVVILSEIDPDYYDQLVNQGVDPVDLEPYTGAALGGDVGASTSFGGWLPSGLTYAYDVGPNHTLGNELNGDQLVVQGDLTDAVYFADFWMNDGILVIF